MLPILCYHKVGSEAAEGRWLNVGPARLESHVRFFIRRGRRFLLARDLAAEWPAMSVCFTFDDAYQSAVEVAAPLLERLGQRGSFYAVTSLVGKASTWDGERARPLADWPALLGAAERGHEVGNHTVSHPYLAHLGPHDQRKEVADADAELRAHGLHATTFCYPYGSLNPVAVAAVRAAGYPVGLALGKRPAIPSDDRLALPRIVVAYGDSLPMLLYKLHGRPRLP